jgi:hypothetical protein
MRYLIFSSLILFMACHKEDNGIKFFRSECMNGYRMPYTKAASNINFVEAETSHFGPLRLVSGFESDSININIWQTIATQEPTLTLNGKYPLQKLIFGIGAPYSALPLEEQKTANRIMFNLEKFSKTFYSSLEAMIDSSFSIGSLTLNKSVLSPDTTKIVEDNFAFDVMIGDCENKGSWRNGLSGISEQAGTLECTEFNKTLEGDKIRYKISLKFDNITLRAGADFKMNDGKMVLDFKIPR